MRKGVSHDGYDWKATDSQKIFLEVKNKTNIVLTISIMVPNYQTLIKLTKLIRI